MTIQAAPSPVVRGFLPQYFGLDGRSVLADTIKSYPSGSVLVITSKDSQQRVGFSNFLRDAEIPERRLRFCHVPPAHPQEDQVYSAYKSIQWLAVDLVVAIGGGAVIDAAKFLRDHHTSLLGERPPICAVPTTSGSGAEVSDYAVVYRGRKRVVIKSPSLIPDSVVVDPWFTRNQTTENRAASGMGALARAMDAFWAPGSSDDERLMAAQAMAAFNENLVPSCISELPSRRLKIMEAVHLTAKASRTNAVNTAFSVVKAPLTTIFKVHPGDAAAVLLPGFIHYNAHHDVNERGHGSEETPVIKALCSAWGYTCSKDLLARLTEIRNQLQLPSSLSQLGVKTRDDLLRVLDAAYVPSRLTCTPRPLDKEHLKDLIYRLR